MNELEKISVEERREMLKRAEGRIGVLSKVVYSTGLKDSQRGLCPEKLRVIDNDGEMIISYEAMLFDCENCERYSCESNPYHYAWKQNNPSRKSDQQLRTEEKVNELERLLGNELRSYVFVAHSLKLK